MYLATMDLLRNRPITKTLSMISQATGLPEGWLASILRNPNMSPSVDRIETLYEYLSYKELNF